MSVLGRVHIKEHGIYKWKIEDFLSVSYAKSPVFFFKDIALCMEVSVFKEEDSLQVAIYNTNFLSGKSSRNLNIELRMNTGESEGQETRTGTLGGSGKLRFFRWMPWTEMLRRRCQILKNGGLRIYCSVNDTSDIASLCDSSDTDTSDNGDEDLLGPLVPETEIDSVIPEAKGKQDIIPIGNENLTDENKDSNEAPEKETHTQTKSVETLLKALRSMLKSGEDNDVIINVQGKDFRAHRGILRARSSVFQSMFAHDMLEKHSGVVKIDDCDPEIFPDFLDHIYTGSTEVISTKNVICLYEASDKYDIESLKEECVKYMKNNLTVDCFCDVITLAVKHDEKELIKLATEFFCFNSLRIIHTAEWQTFLKENATVGNELFIKLLSK